MNTWDEAKRARTLAERGLDFADVELVFSGRTMTLPDKRRYYGERRFITAGWLRDRFVVVVWTLRGDGRRIISMRHGHADEEAFTATSWSDPDDAPHLDRAWFERAEIREDDRLIRPARAEGRSAKAARKEAVNIRLDPDVIAYFRRTGCGW
jgi:hypothetical protein